MKNPILLAAAALLLLFSACGPTSASEPQTADNTLDAKVSTAPAPETKRPENTPQTEQLPEAEADTGAEAESRILVVYFSRTGEQYGVGVIDKGNTAIVAEMIVEATGADAYEILPADEHYPMTYDELIDVGLQEQRDNARPAIADELPDLSGYDTVFIGAPVWWGDWPMILYSFFESEPMEGKTLIPFSTHAGSGLSGFDRSLAEVYPSCSVGEGLAIAGTDAQNDPDRVREKVDEWIAELGF